MAEVFICPTGAVSARSVRELRKAGVVVVETTEPERCQFIRASELVSGNDMLWTAMQALNVEEGSGAGLQRRRFVSTMCELVNAAHLKQHDLKQHGDTKQADGIDPMEPTNGVR